MQQHDVVIVGGGPAGLSAALILCRARRRVLLCDDGRPRNAASPLAWGVFTRDGTPPLELRRLAREQLGRYPDVSLRDVRVSDARRTATGFEVELDASSWQRTRKLLLATGVEDDLPPVEGAAAYYGHGLHHCPYCDGWELRDQPLAVWGSDDSAVALALEVRNWSRDLLLLANGPAGLSADDQRTLQQAGIAVREEKVAALEGADGHLTHIRLHSGQRLARRGLFFASGGRQRSDLALRLGCDLTARGSIATGRYEETCVPGLYVAGDASRNAQLVIIAAAEGAMAAFAINAELIREDLAEMAPA